MIIPQLRFAELSLPFAVDPDHLPSQELARRILRDRIHKEHAASQPLVRGHLLMNELHHVRRADRRPWLQDDVSSRHLAGLLVLHGDHHRVLHRRHRQQDSLQLRGGYWETLVLKHSITWHY